MSYFAAPPRFASRCRRFSLKLAHRAHGAVSGRRLCGVKYQLGEIGAAFTRVSVSVCEQHLSTPRTNSLQRTKREKDTCDRTQHTLLRYAMNQPAVLEEQRSEKQGQTPGITGQLDLEVRLEMMTMMSGMATVHYYCIELYYVTCAFWWLIVTFPLARV